MNTTTQTTRQFKNGNSIAVRIPAAMAFGQENMELEIERVGDEIRIRPKGKTMEDLVDLFAALGADANTWEHEDYGTYAERDWDAVANTKAGNNG